MPPQSEVKVDLTNAHPTHTASNKLYNHSVILRKYIKTKMKIAAVLLIFITGLALASPAVDKRTCSCCGQPGVSAVPFQS